MAEEKQDFLGGKDDTRDKAKLEALSKVGPSKISQELKAKRELIEKKADKKRGIASLINFLLVAVPFGMVIWSIFITPSMPLLKLGLVLLFTLLPGVMIIRAVFFKQGSF